MHNVTKFKIVLNKEFGGFHLTEEMVNWLCTCREWPRSAFSNVSNDMYYLTGGHDNSIYFRTGIDLISCVEYLQHTHIHATSSDRRSCYVCSQLKVCQYEVEYSIEDYHDGKERLNFYGKEI